MENVDILKLLDWTDGRLYSGNAKDEVLEICIDSRKASKGQTYVAIKGERFDGHQFIRGAFENGARSFVKKIGVDVDKEIRDFSTIIEVEDTTKALADIARGYKGLFDVRCIGITGSCGKTSTRNMVFNVISQKYRTHRNEGNFNNHIGLPLTMFKLGQEHEMAVLEMGMSGFGEIDLLASIARPQIAIITNIGYSHIENLGSRENILKAKLEITNYFEEGAVLILNGDDEILNSVDMPGKFRIVKFGFDQGNDVMCAGYEQDELGIRFTALVNGVSAEFHIPSMGKHNIYNALAAVCAGIETGVSIEQIRAGIEAFHNEKMRLDIIEKSFIIVNDAYNANPDSMKSAIDFIAAYDGRRKICILADMLEMGEYAKEGHEIVGRHVAGKVDALITIGKDSRHILEEALRGGLELGMHFEGKKEAIEYIDGIIEPNDVVLVKGSRGMKMEEIVAFLEERGNI